MTWRRGTGCRVRAALALACALLAGCAAPLGSPSRGPGVTAECRWAVQATAWVDAKGEGRRDVGAAPLAGVRFVADDTLNGHVGAARATSDAGGNAPLAVFLPGCPRAIFAVMAEPPVGYRATTPLRLPAEDGATLEFGFAPTIGP
jgi:hypothetical protein